MDGEIVRRLLRRLDKHYGLGLAVSVLSGVLSFFVILFVTLEREGPLPPEPAARSALVPPPPRAEPSPVEHIRSAFDPQARCEMPPEPISTRNFKYIDPEAWFEWDEGGVDWPSIIEEDHDPCGPGPSLPQMDNNGFLPYQRVNPWALSLRGFARTPHCRGLYPFPAGLNSGTCHAPPPE